MAVQEENWSPAGATRTTELTAGLRIVQQNQKADGRVVNCIPQGCRIVGTVELAGTVQIDCEVEGDVVSTGEIIVGETGVINANIATNIIKASGQIKGDIIAHERLVFCAGAVVKGNISSPSVVIEAGVVFEGRCIMPNPETSIKNKNVVIMRKEEE